MAKASGGTYYNKLYQYDGMKILSANTTPTKKRIEDNKKKEAEYEKSMIVEKDLHPNGAFFAYDGGRKIPDKMHEFTAGRLVAKEGLYFTLDKEGHVKVKLPGRNDMEKPSGDGIVQGLSHEIYGFHSRPPKEENVTSKIIEGIAHSFKPFKPSSKYNYQADVAITIAVKGSGITIKDINKALREFNAGRKNGTYKANPKIYIHVSEEDEKVYYYRFGK